MGDSGAGPAPCYSGRQTTWAQAADSSVDGDGESGRHRPAAGGVGVGTDVSTARASFGATSNGHVTCGPRGGGSVEAGGSSPPDQRDGVASAAGLSSLVAETNDTVPSGSHAEDGGSVAPLEPMMVAPPVTDAVDVAAVSGDGSAAATPACATRAAPAESPVAPPESSEAPPEPSEDPPEPSEAPPEPSEAPPEPSEAPPEPSEAPPEQDGEAEDRRPTRTGNCPASPERQLIEALSDVSLDTGDIVYSNYESELQMPEIMQLIQRDLSEPYSIYTYRYFINNWPNLCFLARHTGRIVGAIVCKLDSHDSHTKRAVTSRGYIAMLAVDQRFRKRRIGSCLVLNAIRAMAADAADEVVLETEVTNKGALRLYENLGFVRDKRLFRYYLNGVDALRLKLWLWPP